MRLRSRSRLHRHGGVLLAVVAALGLGACQAERQHYDLAITNASIVDGTGAPAYKGTVLIRDGKYAAVGDVDLDTVEADRSIDANGRVVAPGFIDMHSHGDPLKQSFENFLAMGVTTVVLGQDGSDPEGAHPFPAFVEAVGERGAQVNVVALTGHGSIRREAGIPDDTGALTPGQQQAEDAVLERNLAAGAAGLSTGLEYVPGISSTPGEIMALGDVVRAHDAIIMSHMRSEDDGKVEDSIRELISHNPTGRVHISHLKVVFGKTAARGQQLLDFIQAQKAQGVDISADTYPYAASYTWIGIVFPKWALPPVDYAKVVATRRDELATYLHDRVMARNGPGAILFGRGPNAGLTLEQLAQRQEKSFVDVLIDMGPTGGSAAHFVMDPELQDTLVASPFTALSTDGGPGLRHPRSTGTYARLIEHFVEKTHRLTLEQAVHKASGLPARILQLHDRGTIAVGHWADAVMFDPRQVRETASYTEPFNLAEGFDLVLVNGKAVREDGKLNDIRPGVFVSSGNGNGSPADGEAPQAL